MGMEVDELLDRYGLTRDTCVRYIDAVVRQNMSETAEELNVSTDTVHRYKRAFAQMKPQERSLLIATLTQEKHLEHATEG